MKKIGMALFLIASVLLVGCTQNKPVVLEGIYQSEAESADYIIQIVFHPEEKSFVEYIDNREVDRGIYEEKRDQQYTLSSDKQHFDIKLNKGNSFEVTLDQLNDGKVIELKNINKVPTYMTTEFDDVEEYEKLIGKK